MYADNFVRAMHFNKPVTVRVELGEKAPVHADMLRYDLAFMSPSDPSLLIFPVFKTKQGSIGGRITIGRWQRFSIKLMALDIHVDADVSEFVTYFHAPGDKNYGLKTRTLREFLDLNPNYKIIGFQRVLNA